MSGEIQTKKEKLRSTYLSEKKRNNEIYAMLPYYEDVVILGDSIAESILDFRLLRKRNVIAKRGRCVDMIKEDMWLAVHLNPAVLILEYGKNDIPHFHKDVDRFIEQYRVNIRYLKEQLPATKLYVNSLIPMGSVQLCKIGGQAIIDMFNERLQELCHEEEVSFIDNSKIMDWEDSTFEFDGIHPKYPFYPKWLRHMAEQAGLIKDFDSIQ